MVLVTFVSNEQRQHKVSVTSFLELLLALGTSAAVEELVGPGPKTQLRQRRSARSLRQPYPVPRCFSSCFRDSDNRGHPGLSTRQPSAIIEREMGQSWGEGAILEAVVRHWVPGRVERCGRRSLQQPLWDGGSPCSHTSILASLAQFSNPVWEETLIV